MCACISFVVTPKHSMRVQMDASKISECFTYVSGYIETSERRCVISRKLLVRGCNPRQLVGSMGWQGESHLQDFKMGRRLSNFPTNRLNSDRQCQTSTLTAIQNLVESQVYLYCKRHCKERGALAQTIYNSPGIEIARPLLRS